MKQVSKEVFDKFYEDNRQSFTEVPKWISKESSVKWRWEHIKKDACMWVEKDGNIEFYINEV